jgi:hypothetical protein
VTGVQTCALPIYLKNGSNVPIASGLYLIHIKTKDLGEKVVRWYGIMHAIDLDTY